VYLGGYEHEEHAAEAYDVAALRCKGRKVLCGTWRPASDDSDTECIARALHTPPALRVWPHFVLPGGQASRAKADARALRQAAASCFTNACILAFIVRGSLACHMQVKTNFDITRYAELLGCLDTISLEELIMAVRRQSQVRGMAFPTPPC
jgi:hypothetical protein